MPETILTKPCVSWHLSQSQPCKWYTIIVSLSVFCIPLTDGMQRFGKHVPAVRNTTIVEGCFPLRWRSVAVITADVSEEYIVSIFHVPLKRLFLLESHGVISQNSSILHSCSTRRILCGSWLIKGTQTINSSENLCLFSVPQNKSKAIPRNRPWRPTGL
jgi:hypothetical protein